MQITAALSRGPEHPFSVEPAQIEAPRAGEVLVRTVASGVCHTDLVTKAMFPAEYGPIVLGHEGAGIVEEIGPGVTGIRPGDHVLLSYRRCGSCRQCAAGRPTYCQQFAALNTSGGRTDGSTPISQDGVPVRGSFFGQSSFASHIVSTVDNTVVVDPALDLTVLAPLGCGIQTGAGAVLEVLRPDEASSFVAFGAGGVGLAGLMAARASGVATVIAVDPVAARRELAVKLGASAAIDPGAGDVIEAVQDHTHGGATHALDTTGIPTVLAQALRALDAGGMLVAVGLGQPSVTVDIIDLIGGGKSLRGCIEGDADPHVFLPKLIELHAAGLLPIEELITTYPLADIGRAVADSVAGITVKPVLVF
jgi:aryl-alcohol dehydrogenase